MKKFALLITVLVAVLVNAVAFAEETNEEITFDDLFQSQKEILLLEIAEFPKEKDGSVKLEGRQRFKDVKVIEHPMQYGKLVNSSKDDGMATGYSNKTVYTKCIGDLTSIVKMHAEMLFANQKTASQGYGVYYKWKTRKLDEKTFEEVKEATGMKYPVEFLAESCKEKNPEPEWINVAKLLTGITGLATTAKSWQSGYPNADGIVAFYSAFSDLGGKKNKGNLVFLSNGFSFEEPDYENEEKISQLINKLRFAM